MKKNYLFPILFLPILIQSAGCVCHNKEIKTIKLDLQLKEKTIAGLLDRLSIKDQEIGKLTSELQTAQTTIEDLKNDIEKLREVDVQVEEKKKEVDNSIEKTIPASDPAATLGTESATVEAQKGE
ncbi:MAG: hypothetical protein NG747_10890 [Candidatus Brocadia sp.]|nr:hypothetical protein [Candidatus Brocadia sp.]